jgi:hypothetical protein
MPLYPAPYGKRKMQNTPPTPLGARRPPPGQWLCPDETVNLPHCKIVQYRCQSPPDHGRKPVTLTRPITRNSNAAGDRISSIGTPPLLFPAPTHLLSQGSLAPYQICSNPSLKPLYIAKTAACQCLAPIQRNPHQVRETLDRTRRPHDSLS